MPNPYSEVDQGMETDFRIIHTVPDVAAAASPSSLTTVFVLDSSFNPPTEAHLRIATSALKQGPGYGASRLLLLLATQNADKAPTPAPFEHRLAMMSALAHDCRQHLAHDAPPQAELPAVDVAVTTLPYFRDKAEAIATLPVYATTASAGPPQVHLIGYDTLIRILNPKYYPPHHNLEPLAPFLKRHRLRVTYRTDAAWGSLADQAQYVKDLAEGKREHEGGQRAWADRIELVAGRAEGEETVSSTKVRDAVARGDEETLHRLVTPGVSAWILSEQLYQSSEQEQVKQGRRRAA